MEFITIKQSRRFWHDFKDIDVPLHCICCVLWCQRCCHGTCQWWVNGPRRKTESVGWADDITSWVHRVQSRKGQTGFIKDAFQEQVFRWLAGGLLTASGSFNSSDPRGKAPGRGERCVSRTRCRPPASLHTLFAVKKKKTTTQKNF